MPTIDEIIAQRAIKYKKKVAGAFVLVDGEKLTEKVIGSDFVATKKLDGSMQLIFVDGQEVKSVSRGGNITTGLPVLQEVGRLVQEAGMQQAVFAGELYVHHADGHRERISEVSMVLAGNLPCPGDELRIGLFDILETNGADYEYIHYRALLEDLKRICGSSQLVHPVEAREAYDKSGLKAIYDDWVVNGGCEGIVVHSEAPIVYKVKPHHTFDAAILGFTTQDDNPESTRSLLMGLQRPDGLWQLIGTTGGGLSDKMRLDLTQELTPTSVNTQYIVTDSRGIAYCMVRPTIVLELSAIDFVTENNIGEPKMNTLLEFSPDAGFLASGSTSGVSILSLIVERRRNDKQADATDCRISQLTDLVEFAPNCTVSLEHLPASQLLARRVYTKGSGAKLMIHKFIVYKTNKEQSGRFPAYVLHHTDYSCGRKEPLKRDIRVSSSREQIFALLDEFIAENIKKGWEEY